MRGLTTQEKEIYAWSLFQTGQYQLAAARFENLYSESLDERSAEGLFAAYAKMENWEHLERLTQRYDGPLTDLYDKHMGEVSFDQGLYRTAAKYDPGTYGELQSTYEKRGSLVLGFNSKSGETDLDEFTMETLPAVDLTFPVGELSTVRLEVASRNYGQGQIRPGDAFGRVPNHDDPEFKLDPQTDYSGLISAKLRYEREGLYSPYIELGARQAIEGIEGIFFGEAGVKSLGNDYHWDVEIYRDPKEESVISAIGQRDPYTGDVWGGVTETGIRGDFLLEFDHDILFYGRASAGALRGTNVATNEHWSVTGGFKKDFDLEGFEYFSAGPVFSYDSYSRNLGQYTFGHGGYFSPQSLLQATLGVDFLTKEGREFLFKGGLGAGVQQNTQDEAPYFPEGNDGRYYEVDDGSSGIFYINLSGVHQLTDMFNLGTGLSYAVTPDYNEFSAIFYVSLRFDSVKGLWAHDLLY